MSNLRVVFCLLLICGVAVGLSVWRSEIVSAIDLIVPSQQPVPVATPPVKKNSDEIEAIKVDRPDAPNLVATGTLTASDATFTRPTSCTTLSANTTRFDAVPFTVSTAGNKTISFEAADGGSITPNGTDGAGPDTFLVLYFGSFNPASPLTNCSTVNDDINGAANRRSKIIANLAAGTYTAVITSFDAVPTTEAGDAALPWTYSLSITGGVTLVVTKTADTNDGVCDADCSLREAIAAATAGDTIAFSSLFNSAQTIPISLGQIVINKNLTISGPGANLLTVSGSGNGPNRLFEVNGGVTFNLSGVTLTGVNAPGINGGAISNSGTLNLSNSTVRLNAANNGGGIFNFSTLSIVNSTFSANASGPGGGGGVFNQGTLTISNSTFSGNAAAGNGGGGAISTLAGTATITNTTIAGNFANSGTSGGGVLNQATLNLRNSIVANNTSASGGPDINGPVASQGFNLIENTTGATITGTTASNITGIDPGLGALANNGGPTLTHALLNGSPAMDKGSNVGSGVSVDQRGLVRTVNLTVLNAVGGDGTDIGAFEAATLLFCTQPLTPIAFGQTLNGSIDGGECTLASDGSPYDRYTFSGTAGQQIAISMNSAVLDSYLALFAGVTGTYDGSGPLGSIVEDDNGGGGQNARIPAGSGFFTLPATGTYMITANPYSGPTGAYTLSLALADTTAPTAVGTAQNVTTAGSTQHVATVTYTDDIGIVVPNNIDLNDIRITGPNGFNASPIGIDGSGTPTQANINYSFAPPGGTWDSGDNGTYNIVVQANQVADTSGNFVAAGTIGTFTVNIPDTAVPTATPATAPNVTTSGGTSHTVTVQYNDNLAVNLNTIETGDISVTGPNGFNVTPSWSQTNLLQATVVTATYILTPPGGTWDAADNGTYNIVMQANQVADSSGNFVAAGNIGTFTVNICQGITLGSLPANGRVGVFYNGAATAAPAGTYTYSVTGGSLPTGVNLNTSSGIVSGAPTAGGSSTFTITAADPGACSGSREYTVAISNPPTPTPTPIADADVTEPGDLIVGVAATAGSSTSAASFTGTTAGTNSHPVQEGPSSAIDNQTGTKFLNFAETGVGFIVTPAVHGPQNRRRSPAFLQQRTTHPNVTRSQ